MGCNSSKTTGSSPGAGQADQPKDGEQTNGSGATDQQNNPESKPTEQGTAEITANQETEQKTDNEPDETIAATDNDVTANGVDGSADQNKESSETNTEQTAQ